MERVIWDKMNRVDLVFGSGIPPPIEDSERFQNNGVGSTDAIADMTLEFDDDDDDDFFVENGESKESSGVKLQEVIARYDQWLESRTENMKVKEQEKIQLQLFCDLDGVLVDFNAGVKSIFRKKPEEISPKFLWPRLRTTNRFYADLPWMSGTFMSDFVVYVSLY